MEPDLYQGLKNQIGAAIPSVLGVCLRAPPLGDGCLLRSGIPTHTYHVPILLGEKSSDPLFPSPPPPRGRYGTTQVLLSVGDAGMARAEHDGSSEMGWLVQSPFADCHLRVPLLPHPPCTFLGSFQGGCVFLVTFFAQSFLIFPSLPPSCAAGLAERRGRREEIQVGLEEASLRWPLRVWLGGQRGTACAGRGRRKRAMSVSCLVLPFTVATCLSTLSLDKV